MYKPSFVDLHFDNFCEFIEKDTFLGSAIVAAYLKSTPKEKRLKNLSCPIPPGDYVYENMTVPPASIYKHFPFTNGRIYCNVTYLKKDLVLSFNVDMTLK
ncbi:uncharacterized protein LOC121736259 [Aricia agestis]|uniref:uncharacterized protein LOC121736259 n=1 Tax=Aricia agestis TaxID=91739 RepID=UPI001C20334F|nr:uncharacterized protein LOC121736259 [Aricia agestis]